MQISNYITDLLYRYDCVILPKFGAFISKRIPAKLDSSQQVIVPPSKQIMFNEQITNNDGLLTNYIAVKEHINFEAANEVLENFIDDLRKEIAEHTYFNFPKIGNFSMNKEGKLLFVPNTERNYLKEAFGLSNVAAIEINRPPVKEVESAASLVSEDRENNSEKTTIPFGKYAASFALLLGIGGYVFWNQYKTNEAELYTETSRLVQEHIQEASFAIDIQNPLPSITLNVTDALPEKNEKFFHIIAGAFREEENADKLIRRLTRKGFAPAYLGTNKFGLHQVAYKSFTNKLEAVRFLAKIKREQNKSAWILTK